MVHTAYSNMPLYYCGHCWRGSACRYDCLLCFPVFYQRHTPGQYCSPHNRTVHTVAKFYVPVPEGRNESLHDLMLRITLTSFSDPQTDLEIHVLHLGLGDGRHQLLFVVGGVVCKMQSQRTSELVISYWSTSIRLTNVERSSTQSQILGNGLHYASAGINSGLYISKVFTTICKTTT